MDEEKLRKLKEYFEGRKDIVMAFIFGSYAKEKQISVSDVDIAIYFKPAGRELEWEIKKEYENENAIWLEIEKIIGRDTDLVILNRASSCLAFEILRTGVPILIKDKNLYWRFLLTVSMAAEDFRQIIKDWWQIRERSKSLSKEDERRLMKIVDFLEREILEINKFQKITQKEYEGDSDRRRNLERWVETIVNASIDAAKIILASEKEPLPETYADILSSFKRFDDFPENTAKILGEFAKLRNVLAHEYLDLRFAKIRKFLDIAEKVYGEFINFVKNKLKI
ncbi:MAG: hypothetical protein A3H02_01365 [Candidatus Niyogibacteria bacterium RIFCSPLOWO2_12_FULL_41_13]|uniref:Polymerase beta nucleotidyltransferase domain-containing protein n=1 Tax=Candidatus Niyogibacteria bacterium RIFCSPLOWO2_12_FULL_41_13 TaxID=1801726 RepID=A0A1G2F0T7_9BACT|nr:MAG: hypothetical protein A3H02_01365 [Candidatus Niyogibacteria bacterium RIFCSPLOWO2_12_FULL_41_13]